MKYKLTVSMGATVIVNATCSGVMTYEILRGLSATFVSPVKAGWTQPSLNDIIEAFAGDQFHCSADDGTAHIHYVATCIESPHGSREPVATVSETRSEDAILATVNLILKDHGIDAVLSTSDYYRKMSAQARSPIDRDEAEALAVPRETKQTFLPKDRDGALHQIKLELYHWLKMRGELRDKVTSGRHHIDAEIEFLRSLLDMIERS